MTPRLSPAGWLGLCIVSSWALLAVLGPWLAPHSAGAIVDEDFFSPMGHAFPLGSDYLGRDMLSRLLLGARYTVGLALAATVVASSLGCGLALMAAVSRPWVDGLLSRGLDTLTAVPSKVLALVLVAVFGSSIPLLITMAALIYMPGAYRISRALAVQVHAMEYVLVARARGESPARIALAEVLPNMIRPVMADMGLRFVFILLLLSGMSFLGLGVQPPNADWGALVRENMAGLSEGAAAVIAPALAIGSLTIGVNLLIDSLSEGRPHG